MNNGDLISLILPVFDSSYGMQADFKANMRRGNSPSYLDVAGGVDKTVDLREILYIDDDDEIPLSLRLSFSHGSSQSSSNLNVLQYQ